MISVSRRAKFYLGMWPGLMECRNELNDHHRQLAKVLFKSLATMEKEEVSFLAEKYLKGERKTQYSPAYDAYMGRLPVSDRVLADRNGMTEKEYRDKRVKVEKRLQKLINQYANEVEEETRQELSTYVLRTGKLYLKHYEVGFLGEVKEELIFTQDKSHAKIFSNEVGEKIATELGLIKEEPEDSSFYLSTYV